MTTARADTARQRLLDALLRRQVIRQCLSALAMIPTNAPPARVAGRITPEVQRYIATAVAQSAMLTGYWPSAELDAAVAAVRALVVPAIPSTPMPSLLDEMAVTLTHMLVVAEQDVIDANHGRPYES